MSSHVLAIAGALPAERAGIAGVASGFGWSLKEAAGTEALRELAADHIVVAVLFSPGSLQLPWELALQAVLNAAPKTRAILCHGFAEPIHWPQAADAGAFHSLMLPLDLAELRRSLGFVWSAQRNAIVIPISHVPRVKKAGRARSRRVRAVSGM